MRKRSAWVLKRIGIVALVLACAYGGAMLWGGLKLRAAYRNLREAGRPMTAGELVPTPVDDTANAATLYQAAALCLTAEPGRGRDRTLLASIRTLAADSPESNAVERASQLSEVLAGAAVRRAMDLLLEGARRPACRYPIDYTQGAGILLPHISELRGLTVLMCACSRKQAAEGETAAAWQTAAAAVRLADALRDEPLLISQLVRKVQAGIVMQHVQALAATALPQAEAAGALDVALAAFEAREPFVRSMEGERLLLGEWAFARPGDLFSAASPGGLFMQSSPSTRVVVFLGWLGFRPLIDAGHAEYLRIMQSYAEWARTPFSPADVGMGDEQVRSLPWYALHARILVPSLSQAKVRQVEMEAVARITRAGLRALRCRAEGEAWPGSLAAAGVDADGRTDPFTGAELVYRVDADGFLVYSTGPDQRDDGGAVRKAREDVGYDVVWRHPAAR